MFAANQNESCLPKDSVRNAEATGVFCWNLATYDLRDAVKLSSEPIPASADEFEHAGLEKQNSTLPKLEITLPDQSKKRVPMVKRSPVRFECEYYTTLKLPGNPPFGTVDVVIGRVIGIHIDEGALTDGKIDVKKTLPIARLGYFDYAVVRDTFEMRPDDPIMRVGLEGNTKGHREMQVRQLENGEDKEEEVESKE
jgi:flavin reductase (DIM6/NTAB) family NADH-FMN oxidoreductase RutF